MHSLIKYSGGESTWQSSTMIAWREHTWKKKPVILEDFKHISTKNKLLWLLSLVIIQGKNPGKKWSGQNKNTWFSMWIICTRNLTPKHKPYLGHELCFFEIFGSLLSKIKQIRTKTLFSWLPRQSQWRKYIYLVAFNVDFFLFVAHACFVSLRHQQSLVIRARVRRWRRFSVGNDSQSRGRYDKRS